MIILKLTGTAFIALLSIHSVLAQTIIYGNIKIDREKLAAFGDTLMLRPVASVRHPGQYQWTIKIPVKEDGSFHYWTDKIRDSILYQYNYYRFPNILITPGTEYYIEADALNIKDTYKVTTNPPSAENEYLALHQDPYSGFQTFLFLPMNTE